ncbi:MAG: DUF4274 domain-containing protein [Deinococcota bacterium]
MELSEDRVSYIRALSNYEEYPGVSEKSGDEIRAEARAFIESNTNPLELHTFANTYNWDDGDEPMIQIAHHPYCEAGTALLIYWRGGAAWQSQYASRDEVERGDHEMYDLIHYIQDKYLAGGHPKKFVNYDPADENDAIPPDPERGEGKQEIPSIMYEPVVVD